MNQNDPKSKNDSENDLPKPHPSFDDDDDLWLLDDINDDRNFRENRDNWSDGLDEWEEDDEFMDNDDY